MSNPLARLQNQVQIKVEQKRFWKRLEVDQFIFGLSVIDVCTSQMLYYLTNKSTTQTKLEKKITDVGSFDDFFISVKHVILK